MSTEKAKARFWAEGWTQAYRRYVFIHDRDYDVAKGARYSRRMMKAWRREGTG